MIGFDEALRILGIRDGTRAFIGPRKVQIDLTDECINNCVGCWARSPFLIAGESYDGMERGTLDGKFVLDLVPQLRDMGVEQVFFAGGGDPFCHPDVMEIVEAFKIARFHVTINTNLVTVDEGRIEWLFALRPDELIVSLWAGTRETYSAHHPNRTEKTFDEITARLRQLRDLKEKDGADLPRVKLYDVITRYNVHEIPRMIEYGREAGADVVEIAAFDPIPRRTDVLLPNAEQIAFAQKALEKLPEPPPEVWCSQFLERVRHPDADKGAYDNGLYYETPCVAGWDYARITTTGLVHSCLKSHRIPVGDLKRHSFHDIWFGEGQDEFRRHTLKIDAEDPYLQQIGHDIEFPLPGCFRICDNRGENQARNDQLHGLSKDEERMLSEMLESVNGAPADRAALEAIYRRHNPGGDADA